MVQFVDDSPEVALAECIADYESVVNKKLGYSDPEMLVITQFAYRIAKLRTQLNYVGNQNLISYATGAALEEKAIAYGTYRLPASYATVSVEFAITTGAPDLVIPAGMRIKSGDGKVLFEVNEDTNVPTGEATASADCTCLTAGEAGNGYVPGNINLIVDPQPYVESVVNTSTSSGGSDEETDDQLRVRIPLAASTFSVAGPEDAYIYWAKTVNPAIVDVSTETNPPGTVNVYVLLEGGVIPDSSVLTAVEEKLSGKKLRPLNDTVVAMAPIGVDFVIDARVDIKKGYNGADVLAKCNANLTAVVSNFKNKLGKDIIVKSYESLCMQVEGVYNVTIPALSGGDVTISKGEYANCTACSATLNTVVDEI